MMLAYKAIVNVWMLFAMSVSPLNSPWQLVMEPGDAAVVETDHSIVHSGAASAHLKVSKSTGHEIAVLDPFRAESWRGKRVQLTGWIRTDLTVGEAGLAVITNNAGRYNVFYPSDKRVTKQAEWQKLSVVCDVPSDTVLMSVGVWVRHGNGSVWLDDVSFGVADSAAGKPPEPRKSPLLTREEMGKISDTYKSAAAAPSNLGFEER